MRVLLDLLAAIVLAIVRFAADIVNTIEHGLKSESLLDNLMACLFVFTTHMICLLWVAITLLKVTLYILGVFGIW